MSKRIHPLPKLGQGWWSIFFFNSPYSNWDFGVWLSFAVGTNQKNAIQKPWLLATTRRIAPRPKLKPFASLRAPKTSNGMQRFVCWSWADIPIFLSTECVHWFIAHVIKMKLILKHDDTKNAKFRHSVSRQFMPKVKCVQQNMKRLYWRTMFALMQGCKFSSLGAIHSYIIFVHLVPYALHDLLQEFEDTLYKATCVYLQMLRLQSVKRNNTHVTVELG